MSTTTEKDFHDRLEQARALHRKGALDKALASYEELRAEAPANADLLGLAGVLALQQGRPEDGESLLRAALEAPAESATYLRNLNNLLAFLKQQDRVEEAREMMPATPPAWSRETPPDATERNVLLSLAEALAVFDRADHALALLDSVMPHLGEDPEVLFLSARVRLQSGEPERAVALLERALSHGSPQWQTLAALSTACHQLGRGADSEHWAARAARALPVYVAPRIDTQRATILVLNDVPGELEHPVQHPDSLHFTKNYISQRALRSPADHRFASVFGDLDEPLPELPSADVVYNNMTSGERMNVPGRLERATGLVERIGLPVINHPAAVAETTRQHNALRLGDLPGLRVPRIARYRRDAGRLETIIADIEDRFAYPLIVRHITADSSSFSLISEKKTAMRVHDRAELRAFLEGIDWPQFYVIEFVDLKKPDGNFRKLRAAMFPDDVFLISGGFFNEWMVGGWRVQQVAIEFYDAHPHLVEGMNRILLDPEAFLGPGLLRQLETVRDRMPLEMCGMDFDIDDEGRIVLFEVGAAMNFLPRTGTPARHRMPVEPEERLNRAFDRLVARKIAGTA